MVQLSRHEDVRRQVEAKLDEIGIGHLDAMISFSTSIELMNLLDDVIDSAWRRGYQAGAMG